MDIELIEDEIYELEGSELTVQNAMELASLYIIKDNYFKTQNTDIHNVLEDELNDILPCYRKYCEVKRKYQLNEITDECVVTSIKSVCKEIQDLICTLYSGTDMAKERKEINKMLTVLYEKFAK